MKKPTVKERAMHFRMWQLRKQYPSATKEAIASELQVTLNEIRRICNLFGTTWGASHVNLNRAGITIASISTDAYMKMRPEYRPS
jgi:hypothetical protein